MSANKPPAGKKSARSGAPEWHFADEVDAGETEASNRAWTFFAKHKFVFRASAVLVLLIGFICMLDFKESKYLLRSNNAGKSSWWVARPRRFCHGTCGVPCVLGIETRRACTHAYTGTRPQHGSPPPPPPGVSGM